MVRTIPDLSLPLETDYPIVEMDGSLEGWGAVLKTKEY